MTKEDFDPLAFTTAVNTLAVAIAQNLSEDELALLTAVLKNYVQLTYFEPKDNAVRTATFMPTVEEVSIPPVPGSVRWGKGFRITMEEK